MTRLLSVPYTFVMMNWAAVMGLFYYIRGTRNIWQSCNTNRVY
jgi:hypothetical protein